MKLRQGLLLRLRRSVSRDKLFAENHFMSEFLLDSSKFNTHSPAQGVSMTATVSTREVVARDGLKSSSTDQASAAFLSVLPVRPVPYLNETRSALFRP